MKILLDARSLSKDYTGGGSYALNLLKKLALIDQKNSYRVFVHDSFDGELELGDNFELVPEHSQPVSLRTFTQIPYHARRQRFDVYHSLVPFVPYGIPGSVVSTVFDTDLHVPLEQVNDKSAVKRMVHKSLIRVGFSHAVNRSNYLVCTSYATKKNLLWLYPESENKVLTIHAGLDERAFERPTDEEIQRVKERYNLPDKYLFYIGTTRKDKNLPMMLDAFEEYLGKHPEQSDLYWVMILKKDERFDELFAMIRKRNLLERIRIFDPITTVEKRVFYRCASLMYFVTKYQGLCLPVLEAQAQETAVLTSLGDTVKEIGGKGIWQVDENDKSAIVGGIEKCFQDADLRNGMIAAGLENVKRFSWELAAKETLAMYEHLL